MLNDTITVEGEKIANPLNQEIVTLRGAHHGAQNATMTGLDGKASNVALPPPRNGR